MRLNKTVKRFLYFILMSIIYISIIIAMAYKIKWLLIVWAVILVTVVVLCIWSLAKEFTED